MARLFTTVSSSFFFFVVVVLLLLSEVSLAAADADGDNPKVKTLCAGTPFPELCASMITRDNENVSANDESLVGMAALTSAKLLLNATATASPAVQRDSHPGMSKADEICFETCFKELTNAAQTLDKLCMSKVQLPQIDNFIKFNKESHVEWNCERCRQGEAKNIADDVSKDNEAGKAMAVLEALVNKVLTK
ncbi:uncharacterized protein LOC119325027 [Triticum dicoccoides]|uniref:Pectinesterase inhibitor domain-containing protein n=1 Tax=Triticum turgidum subsp. durum TaxID=4567 RepID=A0A9R0YZV9_TRITD|nr:uncharacterized protein LOC119325027 [Triticum dicoccoides]VAI63836.1 unnamed protein product [Triticum turgidum subsp. durum]